MVKNIMYRRSVKKKLLIFEKASNINFEGFNSL